MKQVLPTAFLALVFIVFFSLPVSAAERDTLVNFQGGIGATPARLSAGVFVANDVFGVNPGGRPWVIRELEAAVKTDGDIKVKGKGLILGGGDNVGTSGSGQQVQARLFCDGIAHNSGLVPLAPNGDFEIDDVLSPLPPNPCTAPVLLIVSAGGSWFAAGIPQLSD
jgi:hypothetical protein